MTLPLGIRDRKIKERLQYATGRMEEKAVGFGLGDDARKRKSYVLFCGVSSLCCRKRTFQRRFGGDKQAQLCRRALAPPMFSHPEGGRRANTFPAVRIAAFRGPRIGRRPRTPSWVLREDCRRLPRPPAQKARFLFIPTFLLIGSRRRSCRRMSKKGVTWSQECVSRSLRAHLIASQ